MSGQGCRSFESFGSADWFYLAYQVSKNPNAQMTRIDIAYDDFNGLLDLPAILDDVHNSSWVSVARNVNEHIERTLSGVTGTTVMFGNRGANIACRIYDKAKNEIVMMNSIIGFGASFKSDTNTLIIFFFIF